MTGKLDVIILKYGNAVLDLPKTNDPLGKPVDEVKEKIRDLVLELINDQTCDDVNMPEGVTADELAATLRQKVNEL